MTTLEDILRMSGLQPQPPSGGHTATSLSALVSPTPVNPQEPADINLTPFMHATCADIALELLARMDYSTGLEMVDTHTLMELMHGLQTELCLRHTA